MTRTRLWLAVGLSVLQPGLGHAYLREWLRAATWFSLWMAAVLVVAPLPDDPRPGDLAEYVTGSSGLNSLSPAASFALMAVVAFAAYDTYRRAGPDEGDTSEGPRCPSCGREVDPELDFCHWCSADVEERE